MLGASFKTGGKVDTTKQIKINLRFGFGFNHDDTDEILEKAGQDIETKKEAIPSTDVWLCHKHSRTTSTDEKCKWCHLILILIKIIV